MSDKQTVNNNNLNGGGYGIRSIQKLRHGIANSVIVNKQPTAELVTKLDETYEYFLKEVDPLIGRCITHLLCKQPNDIAMGMLDFFNNEQLILAGDEVIEEDTPEDEEDMYTKKKPKREQKMYLAASVGPAITKLVNRIALKRPKKVLDYCCVELNTMIYGPSEDDSTVGPYSYYDDDGPTIAQIRIEKRKEDIKNGIIKEKDITNDRPKTPAKKPQSPVKKEPSPTKPAPAPAPQTSNVNQDVVESPVKEPSINIQLAILGTGGAGKSSIINMLQGKYDPKIKPTIGFRPIALMLGEDVKVRFYDLGGGKKIRDIWDQYYYDVHGVIYVIDAASSEEELSETKELLQTTMNHKYLSGKPVLLIANKQDLEGAKNEDDIKQYMDLNAISADHNAKAFGCSTVSTVTEDDIFPADPRLESAVEWILSNVQSSYDSLNKRVQSDTQMKLQDEAKKRIEKERKVLRNKIACAFPQLVSKSPIGDLILPDAPEDVFTMEEGVAFLAGEIGEDPEALAPIALEVAALIGYQRLALQLVGALKAPISKKKAPLSWDEIKALIIELREELGLGLIN
jgi:small GTP-binding protein